MDKQPVIIVSVVGHVSNGKSTLVNKLTGVKTQKYLSEKKNGCTIKTGYANAKIFKCYTCPDPDCFQSTPSETTLHCCNICNNETLLITHISFIDNPGHYEFMKTMMNGSSYIDYAILVESAGNYKESNNGEIIDFPASQTKEHIKILQKTKIPLRIVCLNKFDLIEKKENGKKIITKLSSYVRETIKKKKDIIPISASLNINIDIVCKELCELPIPIRNIDPHCFKMIINRSFNTNKQNININEIQGGVVGGIVIYGKININDKIKILPGYYTSSGYKPIYCTVLSINTSKISLDSAISGGLIGIQLDIDPSLTMEDKLIGNIIVKSTEENIKVYNKIAIQNYIEDSKAKKDFVVGEKVSLNINSNNILSEIVKISDTLIGFALDSPVCVEKDDIVIVNKHSETFNGINGFGNFFSGKEFIKI